MTHIKRKATVALILLLTLIGILPIGAWGGSGPPVTEGEPSYGAVARNSDCPIYPKSEKLIFQVPYADGDSAPDTTVTVKYGFYNPSDKTETLSLLLPIDRYRKVTSDSTAYADKYTVTVNGAPAELKPRHTYNADSQSTLSMASLLRDETPTNGLYAPTTRITEYTFSLTGAIKDGYVCFSMHGINNVRKIITDEGATYSEKNQTFTVQLPKEFEGGDYVFKLICVGDRLPSTKLNAEIYEKSPPLSDPKAQETATLINETSYNLETLVMQNYKEEYGISETDWYNAATDYIQSKTIPRLKTVTDIRSQLYSWYQYGITLEAGETAENLIVSCATPDIHEGYKPLQYEYYFHRASSDKWSDYEECSLEIITPHYVTSYRNTENFQATENGYTASFSPFSECVRFMLCETDEPEEVWDDVPPIYVFIFIIFCIVALSAIAVPILIIVFIIVAIVKRIRRKKKNE